MSGWSLLYIFCDALKIKHFCSIKKGLYFINVSERNYYTMLRVKNKLGKKVELGR
jgi:hypothetical protein